MPFDPDAAAQPGAGVFGLPHTRAEARVVLLPVPFDATTSYGGGAATGPEAIRRASAQVDLHDLQFGPVHEAGIFMAPAPEEVRALSTMARTLAAPIIAQGGARPGDAPAVRRVDEACERVNQHVEAEARRALEEGKIPGVVGGDHSTPFGAIRACAERFGGEGAGLGLLQIDAHMDLRDSFEGFRWSHASIMHNVLTEIPRVTRLVQAGLRDVGAGELALARASHGRVRPHSDLDWSRRLDEGGRFTQICEDTLDPLPHCVYVSFDIDGLDPSLCPHTGTPVPGGLSFHHACALLEALWKSGRKIVGFDLCEVCPGPGDDEWDANVGARILYKLCGAATAHPPDRRP